MNELAHSQGRLSSSGGQVANASQRRLVLALRILAVIIGAGNAGAAVLEQAMGHDGIQYLDQGDAWLRGDWSTAVNGTWSPLYPVILGLVMRMARPSMAMEFPLVHVVNFMLYVGALFAFEYFWRGVATRYYARAGDRDVLPAWAFTSIGYALFIWVSTCLIRLFVVTPDMLLAITLFAAAGWLLRLTSEGATPWTAVWFGAWLGAAYLAKGEALPVIIVMLLAGTIVLASAGHGSRAAVALTAFLLLCAPLVVALSNEAGRFTMGNVLRIQYLRHVLYAPSPPLQSESLNAGTVTPPVSVTSTTPPVYRYQLETTVTYPPSYEQGEWFAGLSAPIRPALLWRAVIGSLQKYFELFVRWQGIGLAAVVTLLMVRGERSTDPESRWLASIGIAAAVLFSLVYVDGRYLAPFIVMLWAAALLLIRLPAMPAHPAWLRASSFVILGGFVVNIVVFHLDGLNAMFGLSPVAVAGPVSQNDTGPDKATDVAPALREFGLESGDRIGVIGDAVHASWARLARLRIVAEVMPDDAALFWRAPHAEQDAILAAFDSARVRAVVAQAPPDGAEKPGWTRLTGTSLYVRAGAAGRAGSPPAHP